LRDNGSLRHAVPAAAARNASAIASGLSRMRAIAAIIENGRAMQAVLYVTLGV
jgi:hypothetical protein